MEELALAIALCCPCPGREITIDTRPTQTTVTVKQPCRRHPVARAVKAVAKAVNHLRPFHGRRRGC
jgi:hypothetical protein